MTDVGAQYWARNIFAIREWAIAQINAAERSGVKADVDVYEVEDWCRVWIENDPLDNGGDGSVRRGMRDEWPSIWRDYKRLSAR
jgi:hypothetical protein